MTYGHGGQALSVAQWLPHPPFHADAASSASRPAMVLQFLPKFLLLLPNLRVSPCAICLRAFVACLSCLMFLQASRNASVLAHPYAY